MIPYGRQSITEDDIAEVISVLKSDWLTQGPAIERFEKAVAQHCGAVHAVACNSATSALHMACLALGLGAGDRLWTSPNTFVASANCGLYCGATVDFVDIDDASWNLDVGALEQKLADAKKSNALPKVLVAVDFAGEPCDLASIRQLADSYGFSIIEDASHAIGARYAGQCIGGLPFSDVTIFSFHPVKIITTGEGGMALTASPLLAKKMLQLRSHGITRDVSDLHDQDHGPWYYEQQGLGYNYRMTDIQAALGWSQLHRLDDYIARRHHLAQRYDRLLAGLPLRGQSRNPLHRSALHLYPIVLDDVDRRKHVFGQLRERGVGVNVHYIPVHLQPHYRALGFLKGDFPRAEAYYAGAISLPLFPGLSDDQQDGIVGILREVLS